MSVNIPAEVADQTSSFKFKVRSDEVSREAVVGLTVMNGSSEDAYGEIAPSDGFRLPTANMVLPEVSADIAYVLLFGGVCISAAYLAKRMKTGKERVRDHVKNTLTDIKNEIRRKRTEDGPSR